MSKNIVGQKIRLHRLMSKPVIKQKDLIAKLDLQEVYMSESTISKIEAGTRFVYDYELVALAKALDVSVLWLLGIKEN